ncbi:hypothetical protein C6P40_003415 [Pichia californica]|uniref:Calnexin n=1 Tax=Pichia californica TaxID=460514 RepID=A0A9P6WGM8_9ASCO|nr:hypothetical protein C6P40_003415 [[Candida] californica]
MRFSTSTGYAILSTLALFASNIDAKNSNNLDNSIPVFKPYNGELSNDSFFEQFDQGWKSRWIPSAAMKDDKLSYIGEWSVEESIVLNGIKNDKGLVAKSEASLHAISAKLPNVFDNFENTLVLQYEVKLQNSLNCGGAYIKLLSEEGLNYNLKNNLEFSDKTPYIIMFGPDKCGNENKVHFIIKTLNPKTNEFEEHHLKSPPVARIVQTTSLYTLIVRPDQSFEIRINGVIVRSGNLLNSDDFQLTIPLEIIDENDFKPKDWIDEKFIIDINDTKPDDWDENAPYLILDENAVKPDDWDEDEPEQILDPFDIKPEDWDDEEDGDYEPNLIDNPECENHGCGKWIRPKIKNPAYRGKWEPKLIPNPDYKGEWEPKLIPNPDYYEIKNPSNFEPIGGLGFEIWTMENDIMFDNIYLGHYIEEAENIGNETFIPKLNSENKIAISNDPNIEKPNSPNDPYLQSAIISDMYEYALDHIEKFFNDLRYYLVDTIESPIETLSQRPGEAFFFSSILIGTIGSFIGFWTLVINISAGMLNSYFENDKTAYAGPSTETKKKLEEMSQKLESIESKQGSKDSKANETTAVKR